MIEISTEILFMVVGTLAGAVGVVFKMMVASKNARITALEQDKQNLLELNREKSKKLEALLRGQGLQTKLLKGLDDSINNSSVPLNQRVSNVEKKLNEICDKLK